MAGALVAAQGAAGVIVALVLVARSLLGSDHGQQAASGYATAGWFVALGGAVLAAGVGLLYGKRWGRAIAVLAQLLLLPVAWSLLTDSHQVVVGVVLAITVLATLAQLFSPSFVRWVAE